VGIVENPDRANAVNGQMPSRASDVKGSETVAAASQILARSGSFVLAVSEANFELVTTRYHGSRPEQRERRLAK
jgi:hypothetical protein